MMDIAMLEKFFLQAMSQGWAAGAEYQDMPGKPSWKRWVFPSPEVATLHLVDKYFVNPGSKLSTGITDIVFDGDIVWRMAYGGWYEKPVVPFLKRALLMAYSGEQFVGGRGLVHYGDGKRLFYVNTPSKSSSFTMFEGREYVVHTKEDRALGEHNYSGLCLIK